MALLRLKEVIVSRHSFISKTYSWLSFPPSYSTPKSPTKPQSKVKAFRLLRCLESPTASVINVSGSFARRITPETRNGGGQARQSGIRDGAVAATQLRRFNGDGAPNDGEHDHRPHFQRRGGAGEEPTENVTMAPCISAFPPATHAAAAMASKLSPRTEPVGSLGGFFRPSSIAENRRKSTCPGLFCQTEARGHVGYQQQHLQSMGIPPPPPVSKGGDGCQEDAACEEVARIEDENREKGSAHNEMTAPRGEGHEEIEVADVEMSAAGDPTFQLPLKVTTKGGHRCLWFKDNQYPTKQ